MEGEVVKTCSKCGEAKFLTDFHKDKTSRDGHCYHCKQCAIARSNKYYAEHKPPKKQRRSAKEKSDPSLFRNQKEKMSASRKKWEVANKDRLLEMKRAYNARVLNELRTNYVRHFMARNLRVSPAWLPASVVEAKRIAVSIKRLVKDLKK